MTEIRCRPIDQWVGPHTPDHLQKAPRYDIRWTHSLYEFSRELDHLQATDATLGLDLQPSEIRLDGWPRASASPPPAVSFTCGSKYGPIRLQCDRFWDWTQNVRAICLTLQRLRLVDEGGCTRSGEQYVGFGALPPGGGTALGTGMTVEEAAHLLLAAAQSQRNAEDVMTHPASLDAVYREAARRLHPDRSYGDADRMAEVNQARSVLARAITAGSHR